eukprot:10857450-Alexandrium_andersonii.AAC.1
MRRALRGPHQLGGGQAASLWGGWSTPRLCSEDAGGQPAARNFVRQANKIPRYHLSRVHPNVRRRRMTRRVLVETPGTFRPPAIPRDCLQLAPCPWLCLPPYTPPTCSMGTSIRKPFHCQRDACAGNKKVFAKAKMRSSGPRGGSVETPPPAAPRRIPQEGRSRAN